MWISKAFAVGIALSSCATARVPGLTTTIIKHLGDHEGGIQGRHAVVGEQPPGLGTTPLVPSLAPRQAGNNNNNNRGGGGSCECKTKCSSKSFVIDSKNCARCIRCSNNMVADPKSNWKRCVPDSGQHDGDSKSRRDEKEKKWPEKKKQMKKKFDEGGDDRKNKNDRRKARRMSLCVPVALMGLAGYDANNYMEGFFSEDYLESGDIIKYWPEGLAIQEWELDTWDDSQEEEFYSGGYLDAWVEYAANTWGVTIESRGLDWSPALVASRHHRRDLEKRRWLRGGMQGVVRSIQATGAKKFGEMLKIKFKDFVQTRGAASVGKGKSREEQGRAVQHLRDSGPLRWFLSRQTPNNHS